MARALAQIPIQQFLMEVWSHTIIPLGYLILARGIIRHVSRFWGIGPQHLLTHAKL